MWPPVLSGLRPLGSTSLGVPVVVVSVLLALLPDVMVPADLGQRGGESQSEAVREDCPC